MRTMPYAGLAAVAMLAAFVAPLTAQGDRTRATAEDRQAVEYATIQARAEALPSGVSSLGRTELSRFNRQRASVRAELKAWADEHGFVLVERRVCHELPEEPSPAPEEARRTIGKRAQSGDSYTCEGSMIIDGMNCMLVSIDVTPAHGGAGHGYDCVYECAEPKEDGKSK